MRRVGLVGSRRVWAARSLSVGVPVASICTTFAETAGPAFTAKGWHPSQRAKDFTVQRVREGNVTIQAARDPLLAAMTGGVPNEGHCFIAVDVQNFDSST